MWFGILFLKFKGGLLTNEGIFQRMMMEKLGKEFKNAEILLPKVSPSMGAALLCLKNVQE
jgi:hypothetical protein